MPEELFYKVIEKEWYMDRELNAWVHNERESSFKTKKEALKYFLKSVREKHGRFDFWDGIYWDKNAVWTTHYYEEGQNSCSIEKWEGFDDEVKFGWEYNGKVYKSANELEKEYPNEFKEPIVLTHHDYCCLTSKVDPLAKQAKLSIKYSEELV